MEFLRILHVNPELKWGGGETQMAYLVSTLKRRGHLQTLACQPGSHVAQRFAEEGVPLETLRMPNEMSILAIRTLRRIIHKGQFDIVHFHTARAHVLGALATLQSSPPIRMVTRRMEHRTGGLWKAKFLYNRLTDSTVAISESVRQALLQSGVRADKLRVIYSGVQVEGMEGHSRQLWRQRFGIGSENPVVGFIGHLVWRKGLEVLLQAAPNIIAQHSSCRFLLIGDGPLRPQLEKMGADLGISPSVIFGGTQQDIPGILGAMDVFVFPSLKEGLGVSVLEAMAAGKPVVASHVGGLPECVSHGETGFLVPPKDSKELARSVLTLVADPDLRRRFGQAGHKRVATHFSSDHMALQYEAHYRELVYAKKSLLSQGF